MLWVCDLKKKNKQEKNKAEHLDKEEEEEVTEKTGLYLFSFNKERSFLGNLFKRIYLVFKF